MMSLEDQQNRFGWWPNYKPEFQYLIDKARLRYDEFMAEADGAFGSFISGLERDGRLNNTAVIIGADHGESFEGGFYTHDGPYQTRPTIHIPLIVRMPGQKLSRRTDVTVDATTIAPTILDVAGLPRPSGMRGQSLAPWFVSDQPREGGGLAFTQYLARNSIFEPLDSGTVGVIDGQHQYIVDLATGKGILRGLSEANSWNRDRSAENPALAQKLRETIYARFPDLPNKKA
jgi:arylsulfatase A-like enzyme